MASEWQPPDIIETRMFPARVDVATPNPGLYPCKVHLCMPLEVKDELGLMLAAQPVGFHVS